ncbi:hypothetical protein [Paenibacillus xerothermodurans]|uniref:Uncharacterized protein n=1 Tax=Paenibacillus xerothermodurans TaxID=1977292 RepID=A0A2W1NR96_PAEXE|nr:hypothetical protein [Paenibacillus xerothermodurans]PZE22035.1 hypothetical protein CBW46_006465 [Paenibacillus xerothermodurans]
MQKSCQKIVRIEDGLIAEIYDGLLYRHFTDNDTALRELLMEDVGLDFDGILQTYEKLIHDLAASFPQLRPRIAEQLPEGWLEWAEESYSDDAPTLPSRNASAQVTG